MKRKMHAKVHNEQLLCEENKLNGKLFDPTSLPILPGTFIFSLEFVYF